MRVALHRLGRVAASLRHGVWNDPDVEVEVFSLDQLTQVVASSGQEPIYGWEFLDVPSEKSFDAWADRLSLDQRWEPEGLSHTLDLFQESPRHLDLRFWFDELYTYSPEREEIPFGAFTAAGRRWWDAFHQLDPRAAGHGMAPLRSDATDA